MSDTPYKSIAVASALSPRFLQVLSEAVRVRDRFGSTLSLVYVGEPNAETNARFAQAFAQLQLPADSSVHYHQGDPATAILEALREHSFDLIVAGALEKEVVLRPFLGNVARRLVREAPCSVMLFTKPEAEPKPLRRIVFMGDYSDHARVAFRETLRFALAESCEKLYAVRLYTTFDAARATRLANSPDAAEQPRLLSFDEEEDALEHFVLAAGATEVPVETRCIRGNTGFAAMDFIHAVEADLLVIPLAKEMERAAELPAHVAWVTDVIPCNLWVIR